MAEDGWEPISNNLPSVAIRPFPQVFQLALHLWISKRYFRRFDRIKKFKFCGQANNHLTLGINSNMLELLSCYEFDHSNNDKNIIEISIILDWEIEDAFKNFLCCDDRFHVNSMLAKRRAGSR